MMMRPNIGYWPFALQTSNDQVPLSQTLQIIVEEAGGKVLEYPALTPLSYGKENILNPHFVVYGKRL